MHEKLEELKLKLREGVAMLDSMPADENVKASLRDIVKSILDDILNIQPDLPFSVGDKVKAYGVVLFAVRGQSCIEFWDGHSSTKAYIDNDLLEKVSNDD